MTLHRVLAALTIASAMLATTPGRAQMLEGCKSSEIASRFEAFGKTGKMPPDLGRWLNDARAQVVAPFKPFDNVYFVGACWVSAWIVTTSDGAILIDTLHEPHVEQLVRNIEAVGVKLADIKYVLITHGHFDHAGGAAKLKPLLPNAKFVMTQTGWDEALQSARDGTQAAGPWAMIPQDMVVKDGDVIRLGNQSITVLATPGHTVGTASYTFDVKDGATTRRAITVGGLGLNAIENSKQVEAYIASVDKIEAMVKRPVDPVTVHLTTHPFSTGLMEARDAMAARKPGDPNPFVDTAGFVKQLDGLRTGAQERLDIERKAGR